MSVPTSQGFGIEEIISDMISLFVHFCQDFVVTCCQLFFKDVSTETDEIVIGLLMHDRFFRFQKYQKMMGPGKYITLHFFKVICYFLPW